MKTTVKERITAQSSKTIFQLFLGVGLGYLAQFAVSCFWLTSLIIKQDCIIFFSNNKS